VANGIAHDRWEACRRGYSDYFSYYHCSKTTT